MRKIQDSNISLRISKNLKKRLTDFSLQYDLHSSSVIRQALLCYLQRQMDDKLLGSTPSKTPLKADECQQSAWPAAAQH